MKFHALAIGLLAVTAALPLAAQEALNRQPPTPGRISVNLHRGRLTASIENHPLHLVLEELSARSGVTVVPGAGVEGDYISVDVKDVPLEEALRRLLNNYDAFFYYGAVGRETRSSLRAVWVYPKGTAGALRPVPPEAWAGTSDLQASLADGNPAVRERAYEALMSRPQSESRILVLQALSGASETDPDLRERLLGNALNKGFEVPPDLLADLVRADRSEGIRMMALEALSGNAEARQVATWALTDPSEAVRARAKQLLADLENAARRRDSPLR